MGEVKVEKTVSEIFVVGIKHFVYYQFLSCYIKLRRLTRTSRNNVNLKGSFIYSSVVYKSFKWHAAYQRLN